MPTRTTHRRPGRPRKPRSDAEAALRAADAAISHQRRRISAKDRAWLDRAASNRFKTPDEDATAVGFTTPGMGRKLMARLSHLVEQERVRRGLAEEMELREALRLCAEGARDTSDRKIQATFLQMVLRVHGAFNDKPLPKGTKDEFTRQIGAMVDEVQRAVKKRGGKLGKVRLSALIGAGVTVESDGGGGDEGADDDAPASSDVIDVDAEKIE